jgi:ATP/maltotriose-dependent transcriptional regulator MalT
VREWTRLGDLAKRVLEHGPQKQHQIAHAYAGIAAARLGDRESAIIHFGAATAVHMETNWFANTLVELAWMQVDPEGLPGVANLASAAKAMREFDAMAERMPNGVPVGPWAFRVRAEIAFAEGDKTRAITMAQRGLRMKHPEIHAPDKVHDHLRAALVRYAQ